MQIWINVVWVIKDGGRLSGLDFRNLLGFIVVLGMVIGKFSGDTWA